MKNPAPRPWRAAKYPGCKTWTIYSSTGGTVASRLTEADAKLIVSLSERDAVFSLTCAALGIAPDYELQADQIAKDRTHELRRLRASTEARERDAGEIYAPALTALREASSLLAFLHGAFANRLKPADKARLEQAHAANRRALSLANNKAEL